MGAESGLRGGLQGELVQDVGQRDGGPFVAGEDLVERFGGDDFFFGGGFGFGGGGNWCWVGLGAGAVGHLRVDQWVVFR